jgi:hypothetical protein
MMVATAVCMMVCLCLVQQLQPGHWDLVIGICHLLLPEDPLSTYVGQ